MPSKLTAIAAGLAALAIAAPAAAQAAPAGGSLAAPAVAKVRPSVPPHKAVKHTRRAPGSRLVIGRKATTTAVTAGSTGDGPANQKECDARAAAINAGIRNGRAELAKGNYVEAGIFADGVREDIDQAMDRGCFIVY